METSIVSDEAIPNSTEMNVFFTTSSGLKDPTETDMTVIGTTITNGDGRNFRFEDETQRIILGCVYCLVAVFGLVGNTMVILAVVLSKKLQTRTNAFVVNLATADLISCLTSPFAAVALFSLNGWPLPGLVCSVSAAIYYISLACSIMNLTTIAVNRYVLITKSIQTYQSIYTPKKIAAMMVMTWLYPVLVCSLPLVGIGKWGYSDKYKTCTQDTSAESSDLFSLLGSALIYPIPLIILFVCYFKIYRHITGHMKKMMEKGIEMPDSSTASNSSTKRLRERSTVKISKRQVEITKNLFYVMCAFVVCLAPFAIALMIPPSDPVIPWTGAFIIFNSAVNPVIYGVKHPHFKEVFRHMLRCRYYMIPEPSTCLRKLSSK
ncbi:muscarinic acetylcholine receptor M4-like [Asterias rubens]|uniref:muscarinic acetylcholine receptor M4-like n=1 Tax=Asterias rubens TaxID=7604 RepID=UPI0014553FAA|nr:muscarinic acetylcholine receptor M4-like [Asterias rubens]